MISLAISNQLQLMDYKHWHQENMKLQPIYNNLQSTTINYNHLKPFTINVQVITIHLQSIHN